MNWVSLFLFLFIARICISVPGNVEVVVLFESETGRLTDGQGRADSSTVLEARSQESEVIGK